MKQEQIEKEIDARLEEPDNNWDGIFNSGYSRGFREGAQWRINSVWHDINEIPKEGEHIVIVMENRCFTSWFVTPDIAMMFKKFRAVLWAYSRDLLPEGKEGTKWTEK